MTLKEFLIKVTFWEIISGLALTLKHSLSPAVTRQYPENKITPPLGTRGLHALTRNESTGEAVCVGCGLCAAMCPTKCISIYTSESEDHKKVVDRYEVNTIRCLFCALCVEACPYGAILLTPHFEYAGYSRSEFIYTKDRLLENWDKYMGGVKSREYFHKFWYPKSADFARAEVKKDSESGGKH